MLAIRIGNDPASLFISLKIPDSTAIPVDHVLKSSTGYPALGTIHFFLKNDVRDVKRRLHRKRLFCDVQKLEYEKANQIIPNEVSEGHVYWPGRRVFGDFSYSALDLPQRAKVP